MQEPRESYEGHGEVWRGDTTVSSAARTKQEADVMTPKRDILMDGFRRDQIYTRAKEREDERKGMVSNGEMIWA